jgi:ABC-type bacteriocin/lantibiotic exporter with double-glycine peptidase domain
MKGQQPKRNSGLSVPSALRYFLKGNLMFVVCGMVTYAIGNAIALLPPLFQQVYTDNIITHKNPEWFTPLIVLYILLFVIELAAWISLSIQRKRNSAKLGITVSSNYIWSVLRLPMELLTRFSPGELVARYTGIPKTIRMLEFTLPSVVAFFIPVVSCTLIMLFNWKLGLMVIASILLLLYVIRLTSRLQKRMAMDMDVTESRLQNVTMTGLGNLETIKSMGGEQFFFSLWDKTYVQAMNTRVKTTTSTIFIGSVPLLVLHLTNAAILCIGAWYILQGKLTPGMLLASQGLVNESIWPLNKTIDAMMMMMRVNSSIKRIKEVTDCNCEATDLSLPTDEELPNIAKLTGEIELRDVTFGYDRNLPPVLKHFSLKIKAGERVALVGSSGCGKSTILSLISGLYEPWEGEVLFDGKPRRDINRMTFINSVAVVSQDVTLFEGSIADNVKMWDESIEDYSMILACNDAQIHQEIMERPGAYQGAVAENGKNFSGGQRQRIEIATALAKEPLILLVDEGTSALDPKTEAKVMDCLYDQGMTLVMIAHRLETVARCDQIYVIEQGRVTQHGTHDELRQMDGLYSNLLKYA